MMVWIWLFIAAIAAVLIALIQYDYLFSSSKKNRKPLFAILRAATVFCILLLFISPKFESTSYQTIKPQLVLMADNSQSIVNLESDEQLAADIEQLLTDPELKNKFEIIPYKFSDGISLSDSLNFKGVASDISAAVEQPQQLFRNRNKAIVLMTDGNQTLGSNYRYSKIDSKSHVYPVVYGDTTRYPDLRINQVNVNRYSYLNNEYPVEILVSYTGDDPVTTTFRIVNNNATLYQEKLSFDSEKSSAIINVQLKSTAIGLQKMVAQLDPITQEKNITNNRRDFAVEVIDQQSKILILSNIVHPDIAALKKAIESNRQRTVEIKKTSDSYDINDYNLVILYGMDSAFAKANSTINNLQKNTWLILGPKPNLGFLNSTSEAFQIENYPQSDDVQPILNEAYTNFNLESFDFEDYPPVTSPFGQIIPRESLSVLMYKQIGSVTTDQPLWFTYENATGKHAVFTGSGLWRWRAQSYLAEKDFRNFDDLINSQIQFLASNKKRDRLDVDSKTFYFENERILISAQYLNKNYEFITDGVLNMTITNDASQDQLVRPFVLSGNSYQVDLSGLPAGDYSFSVNAAGENLSRSGAFSILEFNIEQQFVNADYSSLQSIATDDQVFYGKEIDKLKTKLLSDTLLQDVERSEVTYESLIDWKILLAIILLLLSAEWFLRKYNGLI
ncbi:hypothetical protein [Nonlabens agnitus]|nr:hypothetical protein [Nonlabens agnitus]